jgi:hypothetical protein
MTMPLTIHGVLGRRVATLMDAMQGVGPHEIVWSGRGDAGEILAAGVYVARLQVEDAVQTLRLALVR